MDEEYLELFLEPIRLCAGYLPKFGTDDEDGVSLAQFRTLYGADPLYHWIGFDSELMFAAHKASGGITSLYRQLGIACERLGRQRRGEAKRRKRLDQRSRSESRHIQ